MAINEKTQRIGAEDLVTDFLEGGTWHGYYGYAICPLHDDSKASLEVTESDTHSEGWHVKCKSGCDGLEVKREINRLLDEAGIAAGNYVPKTEEEREQARQDARQQVEENLALALELWKACSPLNSSSMKYRMLRCLPDFDGMNDMLRNRFTAGDAQRGEKWMKAPIGTRDMLVALYRDILTNEPCGVQRFFLSGDGQKIAKWMLGPTSRGAIKFGPIVDGRLCVAEGCESAWTAHTCGLGPAWALGSSGAIDKFVPPDDVKTLIICFEHDEPDPKTGVQAGAQSAAALAKRALALGKRVLVFDPLAGDINDLVMGRVGHKGDAAKELAARGLVVSVSEMEVPEQLKAKGGRMVEVTGAQDDEQIKEPEYEREVGDTVLIGADEIEPENVIWLWKHRIPCGKVTGLQGNPGEGKSNASIYMAAKVSTGGIWTDGDRAPLGSVIFITCEDDPADTIVPRLMAAGADLSKVKILRWTIQKDKQGKKQKVTFNLPEHAKQIRSMIRQLGDVKLIVIDPVSAFMGKADSHKNADVRAGFAELQIVIAEFDVALVAINHMNKAEGLSAINRGSGSVGFNALYRAAWLVCRDNQSQDKSRRLMLNMKINSGKEMEGLAFKIETAIVYGKDKQPIETCKVAFEDEPVSISADDALKPAAKEKGPPPAVRKAKEWLEQKLADGKVHMSADIEEEADQRGISESSLKRARLVLTDEGKLLVGKPEKVGGPWTIQLVPHEDQPM